MDYLRSQYRSRVLLMPQKSRVGPENGGFKHGGYVIFLLNEEEQKYYERKKEEYLKAYPYLNEPAMLDLLDEALLLKIRILRLWEFILSPVIPFEEVANAQGLLEKLVRTYSLYMTRLGLTYVSRQRKEKERMKPMGVKEMTEVLRE